MTQKVNIYSKMGLDGGSTIFFRELTNQLNATGEYDATLFTPQPQPQCKSEVMTDRILINQPDTVVIAHLFPEMGRVNCKRKILSSHEMEMGPIADYYDDFDAIHCVSQHQAEWHGVGHLSTVIPPFVELVDPLPKYVLKDGREWLREPRNVAGIVGHLHTHKQTERAIEMALRDRCEQVLIYGGLGPVDYFQKKIWTLLDGEKVIYKGVGIDKQNMFDSFDTLYNFSKSETYSLTISEAISAGKRVVIPDGQPWMNYERVFDNKRLIKRWINLIECD